MTSWRKFKKQCKKDAAKRTYGHCVTLEDNEGKQFFGILKGFTPKLETMQNGKKHVVWYADIEPTHKIIQEREWFPDGDAVSFEFSTTTKDPMVKKLLGL